MKLEGYGMCIFNAVFVFAVHFIEHFTYVLAGVISGVSCGVRGGGM